MESGLQRSWGTAAVAGSGFSALPKVVQGCSEGRTRIVFYSPWWPESWQTNIWPFLFTELCEVLTDPVLALWVLQACLYSVQTPVSALPFLPVVKLLCDEWSSIPGSGEAGILTGLSQCPAAWH